MKHIKLFEQFVNEKAYQMTGMYGAKGIVGKVLFAFKKEVEKDVKYSSWKFFNTWAICFACFKPVFTPSISCLISKSILPEVKSSQDVFDILF